MSGKHYWRRNRSKDKVTRCGPISLEDYNIKKEQSIQLKWDEERKAWIGKVVTEK